MAVVYHTVEIFQDFSITQILREINFEDYRIAKTSLFAILRAVNFVHKVQKFIKIKIQSL